MLIVAAAVFATFWPVSRNGFVNYDDTVVIFGNPHLLQGLTTESLRWAFCSLDGWNWIPVTRLGHLLNAGLFGLRPGSHHLMSVLYHALAAALLFLALCRMTGRLWPGLLVTAVFALHPLRVESVAWAAELKDPLSGCFFSLTLLAYTAYAGRPSAARYLLLLVSSALGLMAKPTLVPLPFLLLLLDYWPLGRLGMRLHGSGHVVSIHAGALRGGCRRVLIEKIPLLLLAGAASIVTYLAQAGGHAVSPLIVHSVRARAGNAVTAAAAYLGSFLWPGNLAVIYPHRGEDFSVGRATAAAALLVLLTCLAAQQRARRPWLTVGWFWFLLFLVPVLGLVQVGIQSRADRYTYLPLIGISIALAWGGAGLIAALRLPRTVPTLAAGLILIALAGLSRYGTGFWADDAVLFERALAVTRDNGPALAHLGAARSAAGRLDDAAALLRQSIGILPNYAFSHNALGNVLSGQGRDEEAIQSYRRALRLFPGWADAHNNLGASLAATGRFAEAALHFRAALAARPDMPEAADNLRKVTPLFQR